MGSRSMNVNRSNLSPTAMGALMRIFRNGMAIFAVSAVLAGCQSIAKYKPSISECQMFQPIYWSKKDTLKTVQQIKAHNAVGKICGWAGK
jgi:hypothetical protein